MRTARDYIEKKMHRRAGMSAERLNAMHAANEHEPWRARCWNCRQWTEAVRSELKTCSHCGKDLWHRDEAAS